MKFYNSLGPNPGVVKMFMAEKGLDIPRAEVNLMAGENRQDAHKARNPMGQTPCLELDNGMFLSEITAICEYLEEKHPSPPLIGTTAEERAETRMWTRRVDLNIIEPMTNGFRFSQGLALFKDRVHCIPEAADGLKTVAQKNLAQLDGWIAGKQYLAGDRFTLADIMLYVFLAFGAQVGQPVAAENANVKAWMDRVAARPSVAATA